MTTANLRGKVVVVTGGFGALGSAIVKTLTEAGAKVAILDHAPAPPGQPADSLRFGGIDLAQEGGDHRIDAADRRRVGPARRIGECRGRLSIRQARGRRSGQLGHSVSDECAHRRGVLQGGAAFPGEIRQRAHRQYRRPGCGQGGVGHGTLCGIEGRRRPLDRGAGRRIERPGGDRQRHSAQHPRYAAQSPGHAGCGLHAVGDAERRRRSHRLPVVRCRRGP